MANFNLTNQQIKDTYEQLAQIGTSSLLLDGTGSIVTNLELTASEAGNATSASHASFAISASFAPQPDTSTFATTGSNTFKGTQTYEFAGVDKIFLTGSSVNRISSVDGDMELKTSDSSDRMILAVGSTVLFEGNNTEIDLNRKTNVSTSVTTPILSGSWGEISEDASHMSIANTGAGIKLKSPDGTDKVDINNVSVTVDGTLNATTLIGDLDYSLLTNVPSGIISGATQLDNTTLNLNTLTASHAEITGDLVVQGTASFAYLESITGSVKRVGDAFIQVNNDTPTQRFGGLKVVDSGSAQATASFMFDGENNDWMYQYDKDATDYAIAIFGPEFSDTNSPSYPSNNVIQKGVGGGHHIGDSIMTDDGSTVTVAGNLSATELYGDGSNLTNLPTNGLVNGTGPDSLQSDSSLTATPATASNTGSIAIGNGAKAGGRWGIALGEEAGLAGTQDVIIAIGYQSSPGDSYGIGIGNGAAGGYQGVGIGQYANASGYSVAIGPNASTNTNNAIAIGHNANATGSDNQIDIGGIFRYDGTDAITLTGAVTANSLTGSIAANNIVGAVPTAETASYSSGNFEVEGQLFSPTFAGSVASSTSSIDFDNGNFATLNLTAATFLANPTNLKSGTTYTIILDSGSLIANHGTAWKFAGGTAPTYTDGTDVLTCVSDGTNLYATALTDFQ